MAQHFSYRGFRRLGALALCVAIAYGTGCASFSEMRYASQCEKAAEAFKQGDYALAAAQYEHLADRYPDGERRQAMLRDQGVALYMLASYHAARSVFSNYLRLYPHGEYSDDARDYLEKIDVMLASSDTANPEALASAKSDLKKLYQLRIEHPHDPEVAYALGNLLWSMKDYNEAVRYYEQALKLNATYQEKALIRSRMAIGENGEAVALSADEAQSQWFEENPVIVFDTHDYTSRGDTGARADAFSARQRFYNVTGKVRNQSSGLVRNVVVEVRFLNINGELLDVKTMRLGAMGPGVIKAFLAQADNYDNIYNINSYRFEVYYDGQ